VLRAEQAIKQVNASREHRAGRTPAEKKGASSVDTDTITLQRKSLMSSHLFKLPKTNETLTTMYHLAIIFTS
jgi:hypothetical protein